MGRRKKSAASKAQTGEASSESAASVDDATLANTAEPIPATVSASAESASEASGSSAAPAYKSPDSMWTEQLAKGKTSWYGVATDYWKERPATVDGMLGGYGHISQEDIRGSTRFLESFTKADSSYRIGLGTALDCGAGVGRTTKNFLLKHFRKVDLVEQSAEFLAKAKESMGADSRVENYFCCGLQDFTPAPKRYDVIWIQWVLLYLTDDDLIAFLKRCRNGLTIGGMIFVKENVTKDDSFILDKEDNSVTRSDLHYQALFQKAGFTVVRSQQQLKFPRELFPVYMYALG